MTKMLTKFEKKIDFLKMWFCTVDGSRTIQMKIAITK